MEIKTKFIDFLTNHPSMNSGKSGPKNLYANLLDTGSALDNNIKALKIPYYQSGYSCTNPDYWEYVIKPLYVAKYHKDNGTDPMVPGTYWNHLATINKYIEFLRINGDALQDKSISYEIDSDRASNNLFITNVAGPLQQIYFGAPGTGKSHRIKEACSMYEHYRITFHPDTDYASFVGSYKPITEKEPVYTNMGDKAIPLKDAVTGKPVTTTKITYQYVYQAFLNAYIAAWKEQQNEKPQPVFLVIEEINRGNCAQIFGDIFQLLDRNESGFSDYPIIADNDLRKELAKEFETLNVFNAEKINAIYDERDMIAKVKGGSHLLLPNNLYIWATMNTSDQSLFPIDSAFKRRWDWKYVKIADCGKGYRIAVNGNEYDWWEFVNAINSHIGTDTDQEDKKLGYFFAKARKNDEGKHIISADTFLSKVLFFIYNDVYKDFGFDAAIFKDEDGEVLKFANYFNEFGDPLEPKIEKFLHNLGLEPLPDNPETKDPDSCSSPKANFSVIFLDDDNKRIKGANQADTLRETVKYLGLEEVEQLGIIANNKHNIPLLSQSTQEELDRWEAAVGNKMPKRIDNTAYFLYTARPIEDQIQLVNNLANRLGRSFNIERDK